MCKKSERKIKTWVNGTSNDVIWERENFYVYCLCTAFEDLHSTFYWKKKKNFFFTFITRAIMGSHVTACTLWDWEHFQQIFFSPHLTHSLVLSIAHNFPFNNIIIVVLSPNKRTYMKKKSHCKIINIKPALEQFEIEDKILGFIDTLLC